MLTQKNFVATVGTNREGMNLGQDDVLIRYDSSGPI